MEEMPHRQLASKLWLAATAGWVDRVNTRPRELMVAEICPQTASVLADRLLGEPT